MAILFCYKNSYNKEGLVGWNLGKRETIKEEKEVKVVFLIEFIKVKRQKLT